MIARYLGAVDALMPDSPGLMAGGEPERTDLDVEIWSAARVAAA